MRTRPNHMTRLVTAVAIAGAAITGATTLAVASPAPTHAATSATTIPASELRAKLNTLLQEHAYLAAAADYVRIALRKR